MEISPIANLASSLAQARTGQQVSTAVLRKTMDIASANAAALLQSVAQPSPASLPSHLGNHIDTTA